MAKNGTKKKSAGARDGTAAIELAAARTIPQPPKQAAPTPPTGFIAPDATTVRRYSKPSSDQRTHANGMADELGDAKQYRADFGGAAPDPSRIADRLTLASGWDEAHEIAEAWAQYTLSNRALAWDSALRGIQGLKETFVPTIRRSEEIARRYPDMAQFFGLRSAIAARGARTRARTAKAKKQAGG